MSYQPSDEALKPAIDKMIEGAEEFHEAATARERSGEYRELHVKELRELRKRLIDLCGDLRELKERTGS